MGPDEFIGVEPEGAAGDKAAVEEGEIPLGAGGADVIGFEVGGDGGHRGAEGEEGEQRENVRQSDAGISPVEDQQNRRGEGAGNRFAEESRDEKNNCERIAAKGRAIKEGPVGVKGKEIEDEGEDIFSFGGPGDGFDVNGMDGKDGGGEPGNRDFQAEQGAPEKDGGDGVKENIVEVIEEWVKAGEVIFDPECRVNDGVILRERQGMDPDGEQAGPGAEEGIAGDVLGVVPDESRGAEDGNVGDEDEEENRGGAEGISGGPACVAGEGHLQEVISHEASLASSGWFGG